MKSAWFRYLPLVLLAIAWETVARLELVSTSARPGRIKTIVDTRFDKQDPGVFKSKVFVDKVDELWNLVRDEAIKAERRAP